MVAVYFSINVKTCFNTWTVKLILINSFLGLLLRMNKMTEIITTTIMLILLYNICVYCWNTNKFMHKISMKMLYRFFPESKHSLKKSITGEYNSNIFMLDDVRKFTSRRKLLLLWRNVALNFCLENQRCSFSCNLYCDQNR